MKVSDKPIIIILGPQGSGKGTQGKMLAKKLDISYLETGQLFRDEITKESKKGKYIVSIVDAGGLIPDDFTNEFMEEKIRGVRKTGFVIDGYPRRIGQAEYLESLVRPTHAILIKIPDSESIRRISARRLCPTDGKIYNMITHPPKRDETCDNCASKLIQRADDTPQAIQRRLDWYHEEVEPLNERYEKQGILHRIDGMPSIEEVEESIWEIFS